MGACDFVNKAVATSAKAGFSALCEEARDYYGNDPYNGSISTTRFCGVSAKTADKASKTSIDKAYKKADEALERMSKWECRAIDCGVDHYEVVTMKKDTSFKSKGAPKYETCFQICDWQGKPVDGKRYANQTKAKEAIMRMGASGELAETVYVAKRHVLVAGQEEVAIFRPVVKTYKSKPKNVPAGAVLNECHVYIYYGLASC